MDVSVIIGTYNRAILLGRTLTALQGQRTALGPTWELVVVDNNSSDDTRAVVIAASAAFPVPMRYVSESRQCISHARNAGIDNAKGGIIAVTDEDCRPEPAWVQNVVDCMQRWDADALGVADPARVVELTSPVACPGPAPVDLDRNAGRQRVVRRSTATRTSSS